MKCFVCIRLGLTIFRYLLTLLFSFQGATSVTLKETIAVLKFLKENPEKPIGEILFEPLSIPIENVAAVLSYISRLTWVPKWFYDHLVSVGPMDRATAEAHGFDVSEAELQELNEAWLSICVQPEDVRCHSDGRRSVFMTNPQLTGFLDRLISEHEAQLNVLQSAILSDIPKSIVKEIVSRVRKDIRVTPDTISDEFGVSVTVARQIKNNELRIFTQPDWFFDTILTFKGPGELNSGNSFLLTALRRESAKQPESPHQGSMEKAIRAWVELCVNPIQEGKVYPLPFTRHYPVINGRQHEIMAIRRDLVQVYVRRFDSE